MGALLAEMTGTLLLEEIGRMLMGVETAGGMYAGGVSYWACADAPVAAAATATYLYFIVKVRCG
jgi:hypothetical protein